jgi:serine/threonine protein kinase
MTSETKPLQGILKKYLAGYEIREVIGGGGFSWVFEGVNPEGRRVAIKILKPTISPELMERFDEQELPISRAIGLCIHAPNPQPTETRIMVMRYIDGRQLSEIREKFSDSDAFEIFRNLCAKVRDGIHDPGMNVVHRDIKPQNVFVLDGNQVELIDYGSAKYWADGDEDKGITLIWEDRTRKSLIVLTKGYAAPELFEGLGNGEKYSDVYSLGVIGYELLTGRLPLTELPDLGSRLARQRIADALKDVAPPSSLNPKVRSWLDAIIMKCLQPKGEDRYPDAIQLVQAIDEQGGFSRSETPSAEASAETTYPHSSAEPAAPESTGGPFAELRQTSASGQRIVQMSKTPFQIGRDSINDLVIRAQGVSRRHLRLVVIANKLVVENLSSSEANRDKSMQTRVNGQPLMYGEVRWLTSGAIIQLGTASRIEVYPSKNLERNYHQRTEHAVVKKRHDTLHLHS